MINLFKKTPFGFDISDHSIEVLQLQKKLGKVFLYAYGRVKLEKGIVEDGKILDKEKLKEKIKEVLKDTVPRELKTDQAILSLPESKTFFHIFKFPLNLTGKELIGAIKDKLSKTVPFDPESYYFDFSLLSKAKDFHLVSKTKDFQEFLCVGALKETINDYLEVFKNTKIRIIALDVESASSARAFSSEMIKDGAVLIVDIGARTTTLTVYDKNSIRLSSVIPIAGNYFTQVIAEKLNISTEKAEELKRKHGLDPEEKGGEIMLILQKTLQKILEEIKKAISFYENKSERKVKKILLSGGSSFLPKLSSYFSSNLDLVSEVCDPWKGINVEESFEYKDIRKTIETGLRPIFFANVIGLAKRGLSNDPEKSGINLIPIEKRVEPAFIGKKLNRSKVFSFFIVILTSFAFSFLGWVVYNYIVEAL